MQVLRREEEGLVQRKQAADTLCLGSPPRFRHKLCVWDPVGQSLRAGVKRLGQVLFELTGTLATLYDSIDRVSRRDRVHEAWRNDIRDKQWDGVGNGDVRWNC